MGAGIITPDDTVEEDEAPFVCLMVWEVGMRFKLLIISGSAGGGGLMAGAAKLKKKRLFVGDMNDSKLDVRKSGKLPRDDWGMVGVISKGKDDDDEGSG